MNAILSFFTENFWATCITLGAIAVPVSAYINAKLKTNQVWKQIVAWLVSFALTVATYFLGVININEPAWLSIIFTGLVVGLSSNGIYDIKTIKNFVKGWIETLNNIPQQVENNKDK